MQKGSIYFFIQWAPGTILLVLLDVLIERVVHVGGDVKIVTVI